MRKERFPKVSRGSLIEQGEEARSGLPPRERRFPKTTEEGRREEKEEKEGGGGNLQIAPPPMLAQRSLPSLLFSG